MNVKEYYKFVEETSRYKKGTDQQKFDISLYGLVGEIGSLVTEIKKQLLSQARNEVWDYPNASIVEELGDVVWYCFSLLKADKGYNFDPLRLDVKKLKDEIGDASKRSSRIRQTLSTEKTNQFLKKSRALLKRPSFSFEEYQRVAFLTARTVDQQLMEVCLAVLQQLSAQLMRHKLPEIERKLNTGTADRPVDVIVSEIIWHVSALGSLYRISLEEILQRNKEKVGFREDRKEMNRTPLHDEDSKENEKLPRQMEVAFLKISQKQARMYYKGVPIGNDLTDNFYTEDGYRFHDVMHFAHAAYLGWSPVLRKLLSAKRKNEPTKDEVEDGARATIVEEAVLKFIHSEGVRINKLQPASLRSTTQLFPSETSISFQLLKSVRTLVEGLDVFRNKYWEWEDAILNGYAAFHSLRTEEQGTIKIDLLKRELTFQPQIFMQLKGGLISTGLGEANSQDTKSLKQVSTYLTDRETSALQNSKLGKLSQARKLLACKRACLNALGRPNPSNKDLQSVEITLGNSPNDISVKITGAVREKMWKLKIITFCLDLSDNQTKSICVSAAIGDSGTEPSKD